jgi:hypothetical protein
MYRERDAVFAFTRFMFVVTVLAARMELLPYYHLK